MFLMPKTLNVFSKHDFNPKRIKCFSSEKHGFNIENIK